MLISFKNYFFLTSFFPVGDGLGLKVTVQVLFCSSSCVYEHGGGWSCHLTAKCICVFLHTSLTDNTVMRTVSVSLSKVDPPPHWSSGSITATERPQQQHFTEKEVKKNV